MYNSDLSVLKIPTDDIQMTNFISNVEASTADIQHISASGKGLLIIASRSGPRDNEQPWSIRNSNVLDEDYFQPNFPANTGSVDNRDQMHKRGWAYFTITGRLNNQPVSGTGRIPFVYQASTENSPWLKLQVGDISIVDTAEQAFVSNSADKSQLKYKSGSFFVGLSRPWMGLHTLDTIRRDAAERKIRFQTNRTQDEKFVEVTLFCDNMKLVYKIDMDKDVVDEITFASDKGDIGSLKFNYLQSAEKAGGQFEAPSGQTSRSAVSRAAPGLSWLTQLAGGALQ